MKNKITAEEEPRGRLLAVAGGVAIAYAITCAAFIAYAALLTYTNLTEEKAPLVVTLVSLFSVITAGFDAARGARRRGWLWGLIAGALYAAALTLLGVWLGRGGAFDARSLSLFALCLAGGGLGGVIGINRGK
ncbi:MAG: TIGR04086 family membrane protein [Clostridiales bacterium]|jgi:putative membrane protein (TIGR04086 family)|nr:TIGR04086 family membrane protein [Clostridiales bacterium]